MSIDKINLLVSFDENYILPFWTMIKSVSVNNPGEYFRVFLLHSAIPQEKLDWLIDGCVALGVRLTPLEVDRKLFSESTCFRTLSPRDVLPFTSSVSVAGGSGKSYLS